MTLVIPGDCVSQKNSKQIVYNRATHRPVLVSNDRVKAWRQVAVQQLQQQFAGCRVMGYPISLRLTFYNSSLRRRDLDNQASSVMDALVEAAVLEDDSFAFVDRLELVYGGVDKDNPRTEIELDD
jgi:Holliday junction resolvase RusA-like endonuclease